MLKIFAAIVLVTATNLHGSILPVAYWKNICNEIKITEHTKILFQFQSAKNIILYFKMNLTKQLKFTSVTECLGAMMKRLTSESK